jgi:hypothetical protein
VRQDVIDAAGFTVWTRVQGGELFTIALCRQVIAESDSAANPNRVYFLVRQWQADTTRTRRLGQPLKSRIRLRHNVVSRFDSEPQQIFSPKMSGNINRLALDPSAAV